MSVTIYNRLLQPLCIGEDVIPVDGELQLEHSSAELKRLEEIGHISIVREHAPASDNPASSDASKDLGDDKSSSDAPTATIEAAVTKGSYKGDKK